MIRTFDIIGLQPIDIVGRGMKTEALWPRHFRLNVPEIVNLVLNYSLVLTYKFAKITRVDVKYKLQHIKPL